MTREELEGVASHEISHIKNHDIRLLLVVSTLIGIAALLASILWRSVFFTGGGRSDNNGGSQLALVLVAAGLLLAVVGFIVGPLVRLFLSRKRESLADVSGVELTRNPAGLISALKKLQQNDKAVQEHEPRHRLHVHRRPAAASRELVSPPLRHPPAHRAADSRTREDRCRRVRLISGWAASPRPPAAGRAGGAAASGAPA